MSRSRVFLILGLLFFDGASAQTDCDNYFDNNPGNCCVDCTCRYCWQVGCCQDSPVYTATGCNDGGSEVCGPNGSGNECTTFAQNNQNPEGAGVCIPIDGGLIFLIAGGVGMGVMGIRRRESALLALQAA